MQFNKQIDYPSPTIDTLGSGFSFPNAKLHVARQWFCGNARFREIQLPVFRYGLTRVHEYLAFMKETVSL